MAEHRVMSEVLLYITHYRSRRCDESQRYAPGADGPYARPSSSRWSASRAHAREPHQRAFLPPTSLLVSPRVGWPRFSRDGTPEGSQPAFAARGCCPWGGSPSIRSTTERPSLPPSSLLRCLISFLCSQPSLAGRQRGYWVHLLDRSGVRSCLSAGGASSATGDVAAPVPDHVPFGSSLTASWACLCLRPLSALHLG
jgi:hypothetical protein